MTALVALRHDQDWQGLVIVLGILALCVVIAKYEVRDLDLRLDDLLASDPEIAPDHIACTNPDCGQTICHCSKPAECTGCTTLGCPDEGFCWDCRLGCSDCAAEDYSARAIAWMADR